MNEKDAEANYNSSEKKAIDDSDITDLESETDSLEHNGGNVVLR